MAETRETALSRNRRIWGRPRVPRPTRRVMLALLAADGLTVRQMSRLAQCWRSTVWTALWPMLNKGWVTRAGDLQYKLTPKGRACVTLLLRLPAGEPRRG